ncbi:MAG: class I SAM-dependent methyltransferase [Candidatus Omnitrophica bacterium]|nr:class I SAM-dependent methyltransferase [Candidatus Omnitrophota bacterium]
MTKKECYLCKGRTYRERSAKVRDDPQLKVLECASCNLVFLSSFDHIKDDFYENSNMHTEQTINIEDWIKKTEADDERRFQELKSVLPQSSLLDFGCGSGNFLVKASSLANQVCGIEPEVRLVERFRELNLTVYRSVPEVPAKDKFDLITLFHTLEHLPDPKSTLIELSKLLKSKGELIIEVPNADDALLTIYNSEAFSDFTYWSCHLFLFTIKTLKELASQANLKVNYIKQIQRYSLANHLFWLAKGKPDGHNQWKFLDSKELNQAYESHLRILGKCDTIIMSLSL